MNRLLVAALLAPLAACGSSQKIDTSQQMGPNPVLPEPSEELVAAVGVPKVVGWKNGETPVVPPGFKIEAMATGFESPRNVYPLANGDVLVVETQRVGSEPVDRPKDPIRDFIMTMAHGGGGAKETAGAGHGGMDFFVIHAFVESIKHKTPTPMDVYDAAAWSAITPLSEQSIELGNQTVEFPDFTGGQWMYRKPVFALTDAY